MEMIHHINIAVHVTAGIFALLTGIAAIIVNKVAAKHRQLGRYFMWLMVIVISTALAGVFVFQRNTFLLVITMLSGYNCFSGIRTIRRNGKRPVFLDYLAVLLIIAAASYYLYFINSIGFYWSPVIIYTTIGSLFMVAIYDLLRGGMSNRLRKKIVLYEHGYKMVSALSALASAFGGTVLPQFKPYSQFMPSLIGLSCIIIIFIRMGNKPLPGQRKSTLQVN
jgi:uncharacterized membrane protein